MTDPKAPDAAQFGPPMQDGEEDTDMGVDGGDANDADAQTRAGARMRNLRSTSSQTRHRARSGSCSSSARRRSARR